MNRWWMFVLALALALGGLGMAQRYPVRPVTMVVP